MYRTNTHGHVPQRYNTTRGPKKGDYSPTHPLTRMGKFSNTTTVVLQQKQHVQYSIHPTTHMYSSAAARAAAVRECVDAEVLAASYWNFHSFAISRHIGDRGQLLSTFPARPGRG